MSITLSKHVAYHLRQGDVGILKNLVKLHRGSTSLDETESINEAVMVDSVRQVIQRIIGESPSLARTRLTKLAAEIYLSPKDPLPDTHFLKRSGNIVGRILSFLNHDEICMIAQTHVVFKEQASFAFLEKVRTKLSRKDVSITDLPMRGLKSLSLLTALSFFPKECSEVRTLDLASNIDMRAISECFPNVISVDLTRCSLDEVCIYLKGNLHIKGVAFGRINSRPLFICRGLERISFENEGGITRQGFQFFLQNSPQLQEIFFSGKSHFQEAFLQLLGKHCPQMKKVSINGKQLTDKGLLGLTSACPDIESLNLAGCIGLTDKGFFNALKTCKHVKALDLSFCDWVTNALLVNLADTFPDLTDIAIADFKDLEDASLQVLATKCPKLSVLHLSGCTNITDSSIHMISTLCPSLKALKLNDCPLITNESLSSLAFCKALEVLDLSNCRKVDNEGIVQIALGCRKMREIVVPMTVGRRGMIALMIGCPDAKQKLLKGSDFNALCYKMEAEFPAKSSRGKLYQMVLQVRPSHEIRRFLEENKDLKNYTLEKGEWPPIQLYLKMNQDLIDNYEQHQNRPAIDLRIQQLTENYLHWQNNFVILADALAEQPTSN